MEEDLIDESKFGHKRKVGYADLLHSNIATLICLTSIYLIMHGYLNFSTPKDGQATGVPGFSECWALRRT